MKKQKKKFDSVYDRMSSKYTAEDAYSATMLKVLNSYVGFSDQKNALNSKYVPSELKIALIDAINNASDEDIKNLTQLCADIDRFSSEQLLWQSIAALAVENLLLPNNASKFLVDVNGNLRRRLSKITDRDIAMFIAKSRYNQTRKSIRSETGTVTHLYDFITGKKEPSYTNAIFTHSCENFTRYSIISFIDYFISNFESLLTNTLDNGGNNKEDIINDFLSRRFGNENWKTKLQCINERHNIFNNDRARSSQTSRKTSSSVTSNTVISNYTNSDTSSDSDDVFGDNEERLPATTRAQIHCEDDAEENVENMVYEVETDTDNHSTEFTEEMLQSINNVTPTIRDDGDDITCGYVEQENSKTNCNDIFSNSYNTDNDDLTTSSTANENDKEESYGLVELFA